MAHKIVQNLNTNTVCWIHAYLHRVEGDLSNANYGYNRSCKKPTAHSLESEFNEIIQAVFI